MQQQQPKQQFSDEPPVKKLAKDRLDYKNMHGHHELINKENQSNREVILDSNATAAQNTPNDASQTSTHAIVTTTSSGSLTKTVFNQEQSNETTSTNKTQNLTSHFNASLSFKAASEAAAASLAAKKSNYEKYMAAKLIQDENQKKTMLLKMEVQQKARELIEKQIKDQKLLLQKFEQAKTVEEKSQILSLVKKLSESIEKEKGILNNKATTTRVARYRLIQMLKNCIYICIGNA